MSRNSLRQTIYVASRFRLPGVTPFDVREDQQIYRQTTPVSVQLEATYLPKDLRTRLHFFSQYRAAQNAFEVSLIRTQATQIEVIPQRLTDRPNTWLNTVEATRKVSENTVIEAEIQYIRLERPQTLQADWHYFPFERRDSVFTRLSQSVDSRQQQAKASVSCITVGRSGEWNAAIGFVWQEQRLYMRAAFQNLENLHQTAPSDYINRLKFQRPYFFVTGKWHRGFGNWLTTVSAELRQIAAHQIIANNPAPFLLFFPKIGLVRTLTTWIKIKLVYAYTPIMPNAEWLHNAFIWTDYRSAQRGLDDQSPVAKHFARASYTYRNTDKLFFANAALTISNMSNDFGSAFLVDSLFNFGTAFRPADAYRCAADINTDKFISPASSRVNIALQYSSFERINRLNSSQERNVFFQTRSIRVGYGSAFDGWINCFVNSTLTHQTAKVRSMGQSQPNTRATGWRTTCRIVIQPVKKWRMEVDAHQMSNHAGEVRSSRIVVCDASLRLFTAKNAQRQLEFSAHNFLNNAVFEQVNTTDFLDIRDGIYLVPRFFILKYDWAI